MNIDTAQQQFYFNPWDPAFRANPYPHYRALYEGPPRRLELFMPVALCARYEHCVAILHDHERFSSIQPPPPPGLFPPDDPFVGSASMLFSDPPVHTRLRRLISRDFTPRRIRQLEPRIREITRNLLDRASQRGEFDVIRDLATPLPVMVIAEMLGIPPERYETFKQWSDTIIAGDNNLPGTPIPPEIISARNALRDYFTDEIEKRKRRPGPDLVSALVAAHQETEALTAGELLNFVVLLLLAGNETTTNLIGNGMLALGRHPEQMALLRREPSLLPGAIEEMLRYDGPVQSTVRHTREPIELDEIELDPGTLVFVLLAAANRDPARFDRPDEFDITRAPADHLAFGEGIHYCIGAPLARLEGQAAIGMALEKFPTLRLADPAAPLSYKGSFFLRGLSELPMPLS